MRENGVRALRMGKKSHIRLQPTISTRTMRRRRGWRRINARYAAAFDAPKISRTTATMMATRSTAGHNTPRPMAHFDIPLDIPHAGRIADRLLTLLGRYTEERSVEAPEVTETAEKIWALLFRFTGEEDNPLDAPRIRDEAAQLGRQLVDEMERAGLAGDRLGQLVRNYFECLELGAEGAEISLRAGEDPRSLQRPYEEKS